jgi:phosphatidylglycerol:prolipoprotein diacylglycerol transferase
VHHTLFTLPGGFVIQSYGFCLAIAFLCGMLLARRRAKRVGADPQVILNVSLLAVVFGVGGARLLSVVHYWDRFAAKPNPLWAAIDLRQGGLEFLGGFIAATLAISAYLVMAKHRSSRGKGLRPFSICLYLDVLTPSLMCGLAITRIGCFLNGCCFGGVCVVPGTQEARYPWALRFPYGSPPYVRQWEEGAITAPEELVVTTKSRTFLIPRSDVFGPLELREANEVERADGGARGEGPNPIPAEPRGGLPRYLAEKLQQPSREDPLRAISLSELRALASASSSLPIHPTQLYAMINAALLWGLLSAVFRVRRRYGVVFAALLILYPVSRFILEAIRADNPSDTLGLTVSQFASVVIFVFGVATLVLLWKLSPELEPGGQHTRRSGESPPHGRRGSASSASRTRTEAGQNAAPRGRRRRPRKKRKARGA